MDLIEDKWKKFDIVNSAIQLYLKKVEEIQEKKEQKLNGKKTAEYLVECSKCRNMVKLAFTAVNYKKKEFVCFNCLV